MTKPDTPNSKEPPSMKKLIATAVLTAAVVAGLASSATAEAPSPYHVTPIETPAYGQPLHFDYKSKALHPIIVVYCEQYDTATDTWPIVFTVRQNAESTFTIDGQSIDTSRSSYCVAQLWRRASNVLEVQEPFTVDA